ncbi:OLC1v1021971C2 [Oldenlandia corymbosa var. corymbosa]|nr:OLC1v1021971C2 [Oldenlandia corymbosa var. corymbosa]
MNHKLFPNNNNKKKRSRVNMAGHEYNNDWRWEEGDTDEESKKRKIPSKGYGGLHANDYLGNYPLIPAADDDDDDDIDDDALWAKGGPTLDFSDAGLNKHYPGQAMKVDLMKPSMSSFCGRRRASTSRDQGNQLRNPTCGGNLIPPMTFSRRASSAQGNQLRNPICGGNDPDPVSRPLSTRASPSYDQVSGNQQEGPISSGTNYHNMDGDDDEYAEEIQLPLYNQSVLDDDDDDEFDRDIQLAINQSLQTSSDRRRPNSNDLIKLKGVCVSHPLKKLDNNYFNEEIKRFGMAESGDRGEPIASLCVICGDDKSTGIMKKGPNCSHFFCPGCINSYVWERTECEIENMDHTTAKCPHKDCREILSAKQCREFLITPERVTYYMQNENRLRRLLAAPKYFECPFEDCSRQILDDGIGHLIRACTFCSRIFCMICKHPWHLGLTCAESRKKMEEQRRREWLRSYLVELQQKLGVENLFVLGPNNLLD